MRKPSFILTWAAVIALLALSMSALAGPPSTSARGVTPAKRAVRFVAPPGALVSANDTCAAAIVVPASGPFPWTDTQDTTGNGTDSLPSCSTNGGADEWYTFTPATSGLYNFSTCASTVDTILALYTGACGSLTEVTCNDDSCGLESMLVQSLTAGTTYTVQILGYNGDAGSIPFTVTLAPDLATVVTSFPADPSEGGVWGCGYSDNIVYPTFAPGPGAVWTAEYNTLSIREWTTAGVGLGPFYSGYWADMDYDSGRSLMYQMDIPGGGTRQDNCIHSWYPATGAAGMTLCDPASIWSANVQQAVAHDPDTDTFYVGGWVDGKIYHVAGTGSTTPTPGSIIDSWTVGPVSGLAWLCDGTLAAALNEPQDRILILDPANAMAVLRSYTLPNPSGYASAGMDAQPDGQVWLINQNDQYAYLVDLGTTCGCPTITLSPSTLPNGSVGAAYSQTITATGGTGFYTFTVTAGSLPTGLTLATGGLLNGTPTTAGVYTFTVTAEEGSGRAAVCTGSQEYTVVICGTITLSPSTLPDGTVGTAYSQTITAAGGTAPYSYTVTAGTLPTGITLSTAGVLSGTPSAAGAFSFTVTATDTNGCTGTASYTVTVTAPDYDAYIYDDYGRASLCLNSATGAFLYKVLTGYGAGQSFTGVATSTLYNGVLNFRTPAGLPYSLVGSYLQVYHKGKASFTYRPLRINSTAYDNNTLNNPPGCGSVPAK